MIEAIHQDKLKAMYLFGEEISLVDSNANYVNEGLSRLEFFVVQDIFFSDTCRFADVVLPASVLKNRMAHKAYHCQVLRAALSV